MLSAEEKAAGRKFADTALQELHQRSTQDPPNHVVPTFISVFRHLCPARNRRSTALDLKEMYVVSPIYPEHGVPAGRFGFIYRQGRCRGCGQTARSDSGWLVDGFERPPINGRVARS